MHLVNDKNIFSQKIFTYNKYSNKLECKFSYDQIAQQN